MRRHQALARVELFIALARESFTNAMDGVIATSFYTAHVTWNDPLSTTTSLPNCLVSVSFNFNNYGHEKGAIERRESARFKLLEASTSTKRI